MWSGWLLAVEVAVVLDSMHMLQMTLAKSPLGDVGGGLIADTELETGRAPVNKLDGALGLDNSNGSVNVLRDDIASVE